MLVDETVHPAVTPPAVVDQLRQSKTRLLNLEDFCERAMGTRLK
ncbi:MAG: hypothetical protein ACM3MK_11925 [Chitinophagales bacterium]